jgi:6-phosphogluconolactonase
VYPIQNGIVNSKAVQVMDAPMNPHMIKTDASGKYVLVPNKGADQVQQFIFNKDGSLTPNTPSKVSFKQNTGPRHFTFNPSGDKVYVVNEISCTVDAFRYNKKEGTLAGPFQEITTKPSDFNSDNTCADIHITPNGKYLYASNRGHDSLAGYAVDQKTGILTPIGWFATEKEPREFAIDPSGEFVIAAGESSGRIALYRIKDGGKLAQLKTYEVGHWPVWVLTL